MSKSTGRAAISLGYQHHLRIPSGSWKWVNEVGKLAVHWQISEALLQNGGSAPLVAKGIQQHWDNHLHAIQPMRQTPRHGFEDSSFSKGKNSVNATQIDGRELDGAGLCMSSRRCRACRFTMHACGAFTLIPMICWRRISPPIARNKYNSSNSGIVYCINSFRRSVSLSDAPFLASKRRQPSREYAASQLADARKPAVPGAKGPAAYGTALPLLRARRPPWCPWRSFPEPPDRRQALAGVSPSCPPRQLFPPPPP